MNTNNHNKNDDWKAVPCPSGCGIIIKWKKARSGKNYYSNIRTGEKHRCRNKSQHIAVEEPPKLQTPQDGTRGERTEKANRAITRIEFINIIQSFLDFGNEHFMKEEGGYRLIPDYQSVEKEK